MHFPHHGTVSELATVLAVVHFEWLGIDCLEELGVMLRAQAWERRRLVPSDLGKFHLRLAVDQSVPGHDDVPIGLGDEIEHARVLDRVSAYRFFVAIQQKEGGISRSLSSGLSQKAGCLPWPCEWTPASGLVSPALLRSAS